MVAVGLLGILVVPATVGAEEANQTTQSNEETVERKAQEARERAEAKAREAREKASEAVTEKKEEAKKGLTEAKRTVCERRKETIVKLMNNVVERGNKQIELLTTIANRTKTFYEQKGKTLANYDELVAGVDTKKAAAEAALASIDTIAQGFDCSGDDPKGKLGFYRETVKTKIGAITDYRQSVRSLIAGVKSVQGEQSNAEGQS